MAERKYYKTREEYVDIVKKMGEEIVNRADDIVGDMHKCVEIHVEFDIGVNETTRLFYSKKVIPEKVYS